MFSSDSFAYLRDDSIHVRNSAGKHWTVRLHNRTNKPYVTPHAKHGSKFYARPGTYSDMLTAVGHGLMNFVLLEGSWAWRTGQGRTKEQAIDIKHTATRNRLTTSAMNGATTLETGNPLTATQYAQLGHGARFTRGHSNIDYEWCHLVAHGLGGKDTPINLVAATKYQNTEQLILENVLYEYRMEGLKVAVEAKLASGTQHLAESIWYRVSLTANNVVVYERTMDCRRATNPTYDECVAVASEMRCAINSVLSQYFPVDGFDPAVEDHVDLLTEEDESNFIIC